MATATSPDGTRIDYDITGDGPTVILIGAGPNDRSANAELASLLAGSCRAVNYDRRGRGASGDIAPYDVDKEVADLQSVANALGGPVSLFGTSGGAFLAFRAAAAGMALDRIAAWEPPYVLPGARPPVPGDYAEQQARFAAAGEPGNMTELFLKSAVGMPAEMVDGMMAAPFWQFLEAAASPALLYDAVLAGDFSVDRAQLGKVGCPVLILDGGTTPWLSAAAEAAADAIGRSARRQTLTGQQHNVEAAALAPALADFFGG